MRESKRVRSHFGSSRRPTLWLEFPLAFKPLKVCLQQCFERWLVWRFLWLDLRPLRPRAVVVLEQVLPAMQGSEAQRFSRRS